MHDHCNKIAFVTQYSLKFSNDTSYGADLYKFSIVNPETGSNIFSTEATRDGGVNFFKPVLVSHLRIYPQGWVYAMVLKWEVVFCLR